MFPKRAFSCIVLDSFLLIFPPLNLNDLLLTSECTNKRQCFDLFRTEIFFNQKAVSDLQNQKGLVKQLRQKCLLELSFFKVIDHQTADFSVKLLGTPLHTWVHRHFFMTHDFRQYLFCLNKLGNFYEFILNKGEHLNLEAGKSIKTLH